jgi:predicted metalloprotease|tara:strand:+ start:196 stop:447 length:252 start_codon:yes stop_codon:yes gene_type:complete
MKGNKMSMLQNSILLDEEFEYEDMIVDFWKVKDLTTYYDEAEAVALAMDTFDYYNPNIPKEEIELHLLELWSEFMEDKSYKHV